MRRINYSVVKDLFESRGYELLSTKYVNSDSKLLYKCSVHPDKELYITYRSLRSGNGCPYCSGKARHTLEDAVNKFKEIGYVVTSTEYVNVNTKISYVCPNHPDKDLSMSLHNLNNGKRCPHCSGNPRYTLDEVRCEFSKRGYILLSDCYEGSHSKLYYSCPHHPDKTVYITFTSLLSGNGCKYCAIDARRGSGNNMWRGGVSSLNDFLRGLLNEWKSNALRDSKFTCSVTGTNKNLEVHHIHPFNKIRDLVIDMLDIPLRTKVSEYSEFELDLISRTFMEVHLSAEYSVLTKSVHKLFHSLYGFNTTKEDFDKFRARYLSGEFD